METHGGANPSPDHDNVGETEHQTHVDQSDGCINTQEHAGRTGFTGTGGCPVLEPQVGADLTGLHQ